MVIVLNQLGSAIYSVIYFLSDSYIAELLLIHLSPRCQSCVAIVQGHETTVPCSGRRSGLVWQGLHQWKLLPLTETLMTNSTSCHSEFENTDPNLEKCETVSLFQNKLNWKMRIEDIFWVLAFACPTEHLSPWVKLPSPPDFSQALEAQDDCTVLVWQLSRTVYHLRVNDTTAQIISLSPQWPHIHVERRDDRMKPCGILHEKEPSGLMSNCPMTSSGISLRGKSGTTQVQSLLPQPRSTGESEKHHGQCDGQRDCWQS